MLAGGGDAVSGGAVSGGAVSGGAVGGGAVGGGAVGGEAVARLAKLRALQAHAPATVQAAAAAAAAAAVVEAVAPAAVKAVKAAVKAAAAVVEATPVVAPVAPPVVAPVAPPVAAAAAAAAATAARRLTSVAALHASLDYWGWQSCSEFGFYQTCEAGTGCFFTPQPLDGGGGGSGGGDEAEEAEQGLAPAVAYVVSLPQMTRERQGAARASLSSFTEAVTMLELLHARFGGSSGEQAETTHARLGPLVAPLRSAARALNLSMQAGGASQVRRRVASTL